MRQLRGASIFLRFSAATLVCHPNPRLTPEIMWLPEDIRIFFSFANKYS
jgi:hypothetical protein